MDVVPGRLHKGLWGVVRVPILFREPRLGELQRRAVLVGAVRFVVEGCVVDGTLVDCARVLEAW